MQLRRYDVIVDVIQILNKNYYQGGRRYAVMTTLFRYDVMPLRRYDVIVAVMQISLNHGGKMQIPPRLELCRANQDQIKNFRKKI